MPVIVSFEYMGERRAAPAGPPEITIGYIYIYNPNSFDLSNWPVYVRFTQENFSFSSAIHSQGNNLRFRSLENNLLNYFLGEWYHGVFGEAFIQIPSLPANSTVTIKVNYEPSSNIDYSNFSAVALSILDGLYSEWRFCHPSNSTLYDSGGSNWHGKVVWTAPFYQNKTPAYFDIGFKTEMDPWSGFQFGGGEMPYRSITNSAPFTWELFIKWQGFPWGYIMNTNDAETDTGTFILISGSSIKLQTCNGDCKALWVYGLTSDTWYHVVGLFASNYISLRVNGTNTSSAISSNHTDFNPENEPLRLAIDSTDFTIDFPFLMEYARVWNRILSDSEIELLKNHYSVATSRFPNKVCVLNWTEDKPQVFIESC